MLKKLLLLVLAAGCVSPTETTSVTAETMPTETMMTATTGVPGY